MPTDRDAERPANGNMFPEKGNKLHPENKAGAKTEQRAFAAVWGGVTVELSTIRDDEQQAEYAAEDAFSGWRPALEAGWRIRPVLIRVEDETQETGHDR